MRIIVLFFGYVWSSVDTSINLTSTTWEKAKLACEDSHHSLINIKDVKDFYNITTSVNVTGDITLWIGGKERRKFFMWNNDHSRLVHESIGCFKSGMKLSEQFVENQPSLCISYCQHRLRRPFAGLSGQHCFCYHDLHDVTQVRDRLCYSPCRGDDNYICGAGNTATIYRTDDSIKWILYEPGNANKRDDCVLVTHDQEGQTVWYTDRCSHEHQYICRIYDKTICQFKGQMNPPCYFRSVEKASWFEAVRKCSGMRGHLAGKDMLENYSLAFNHTSFWSSLARLRQRWSDGTDISNSLHKSEAAHPRRTGCLSLRRQKDKWTIEARPCREHHPFICSAGELVNNSVPSSPTFANNLTGERKTLLLGVMIGITGTCIGVIVFICIFVYCLCKRKRRNKVSPSPTDHFYFILEKESVYNTISINTHAPDTIVTSETYYDFLAFDGTAKYSDRQKSISEQSEGDNIYNRSVDVNDEYDKLQFKSPTNHNRETFDNYFKLSSVVNKTFNSIILTPPKKKFTLT